jgi:hypothetical protein
MNEMWVLDTIEREFRAMHLPIPDGLTRPLRHTPQAIAWARIARRIVDECNSDNRRAARTASIAGSMITRGRTKL